MVQDIEINYGRHAVRRFQSLLENNSISDGELSDQENQEIKERFETELIRTLFTREGK
jgi:hypothetical protein